MQTIADLIKAEQQEPQTNTATTVEASTTEVAASGDLVINETVVEAPKTEVETTEENISTFAVPEFTEPTKTETEVAANQTVGNWQEAIKQVDKKELAKAAGISDFALELNEYIANGGNAADYLAAKAIDYTKVSDADLIFEQLKSEFPDATAQQLQRLFNKKYNQSELADEEDREDGQLMISADARKLRQAKIEQQSKFKIPEQVKLDNSPDLEQIKLEAEQAQAKEYQKLKAFYESHKSTKDLMNSKRVAVKLGDKGVFNFSIDKPEVLTQLLLDGETWQKATSNAQGEPDLDKLHRIALVALNPNYELDIYNSGMAAGRKSLIEEGQNAKRPIGQQPSGVAERGLVIKGSGTLKQHLNGN